MTDNINPEIRERIDALLDEVAAGFDLDNDTREELRAHMMEKFQDYKSGAEPVSDDDAFVLVREHFGKPEIIRTCFQEHRERVTPTLFFRWFSAAAITCSMFIIVQAMLQTTLRIYTVQAIMAVLIGVPLWYWKVQEHKGRKVWYLSPQPWLLLSSILILVFTLPLPAHLTNWGLHRFSPEKAYFPVYPPTGLLIYQLVFILWWFDRKPRYLLVPLGAAAIMVFFSIVWAVENWIYAPYFNYNGLHEIFWFALISIMIIAMPVYLLVTAVFAWGRRVKLAIER